ncbi:hypothetical protein KIN20_020767 [Parelaphostrongylus tenuis]|uniref:Uncharacterized protein n=1 Tax=Parelaphostrongylus tenuis TaxID=148309 RepID=A0AAD5MMY2_PARTN|nr:hypothetical protein KIN20_020767 [Parelaphostrongylus tenuis]
MPEILLEDEPRSERPTKFESFDEVEEASKEFFDSMSKELYSDQLRNLSGRWQKAVGNDGLYFEE